MPKKPAPSNLLSKLSKLAAAEDRKDDAPPPPRTSSLTEKAVIRDENLAIIEDFEPGPYDHTPPFDDPNFDKLEPNSGIRLSYVLSICLNPCLTILPVRVHCLTKIYKNI